MLKALPIGIGMFFGILLYTKFISSVHQFDLVRAAFIGGFAFIAMWIHFYLKTKKGSAPA